MSGHSSARTARDPAVLEVLARALYQVDRRRVEGLDMDSEVGALGVDSVAMLEVIGYLEDELAVHLSEDRLHSVRTVGDLADAIAEARTGGSR